MTETDDKMTSQFPAQQPPSLSSYYSNPKLKPSSFIKSIRATKTKVFQSQDIAHAHAVLSENDPDLSRTLAVETESWLNH